MTLKKASLFFTFVFFILTAAYAADAYNQYVKIYGKGVVIASDKALPPRNQVDLSLVDFKNGISYIKGGPGASFHIRAFTENGKTFGEDLDELKKGFDADKIIEGSERLVMQIWTSHDVNGKSNMDSYSVWPNKLANSPNWHEFCSIKYFPEGSLNVNNNGYEWSDLTIVDSDGYSGDSLEKWLKNAKPGYKIYIQFYNSIVINYQWDPINQEWKTMLYKNKPVAAGTIEIK
jgi:hypothetical protein